MRMLFKVTIVIFIFIFLAFICFIYFYRAPKVKKLNWGVDFSQMQSEVLGLDWKENYIAILKDLGAKNIKIHTQWDWVQGDRAYYHFSDIDWQIAQAQKYNANIIFVLGLKTGRWPECHQPQWFNDLPKDEQQGALLDYVRQIVQRYKNNETIIAWQTENEPFFNFGNCPDWYYESDDFIKQEVSLIKSLDAKTPVIISDTGEYSFWTKPAKIA